MSQASGGEARADAARRLSRLAARQLGLITTAQADSIGLSRRWLYRAQETGKLIRLRRTVYALLGSTPSWRRSVLAAVLAAGPEAVASHETAAQIWGLTSESRSVNDRDFGPADAAIHITVPTERRLEGVVAHRQRLPSLERSRHAFVPVTSPARTLYDLAQTLDSNELGACVDEALRRRIVDLAAIRRTYEAHAGPGRRRIEPLKEVLAGRVPGFDPGANPWERAMDDLWDTLGLPASRRQYRLKVGNRSYRLDRAIPELRLAVEWVGSEFHGQLGRYRDDRLRISDLVQAGWDVVEIAPGWTPERIRRTVMAKVEERTRFLATG